MLNFASRLLLAAGALLGIAGCTQTYVTPMAVTTLVRLDRAADQSALAGSKSFTLPHDWQYGTWVIKRGATIVFNADGTGHFSGVCFAQQVNPAYGDEIHLQSMQYASDGNLLFTFPGTEVGLPMAIRTAYRDVHYDFPFGYDPRYFPAIDSVKWYGRLRLRDVNVGYPYAPRTSQSRYLTGPTRLGVPPNAPLPSVQGQ